MRFRGLYSLQESPKSTAETGEQHRVIARDLVIWKIRVSLSLAACDKRKSEQLPSELLPFATDEVASWKDLGIPFSQAPFFVHLDNIGFVGFALAHDGIDVTVFARLQSAGLQALHDFPDAQPALHHFQQIPYRIGDAEAHKRTWRDLRKTGNTRERQRSGSPGSGFR